jgi:ketosteroid isomerase-like protein
MLRFVWSYMKPIVAHFSVYYEKTCICKINYDVHCLKLLTFCLTDRNMKKIILTGVFILTGISFLNAQKKEQKDLIISQIQNNDRRLEVFMEKGTTDSIVAMFSPNCHLVNEFGTIVENKDKVKDYYTGEKKAGKKLIDYTLKPTDQKVYDDIVLEIGTNTVKYSIGAEKRLFVTEYNYMLVWKKSKSGSYQIRAAMWNLTKDPCAQ